MTIEDAIKAVLTGSPYPLAVNARVWFQQAPERPTQPYIVFHHIYTEPLHVHSGSPMSTIIRVYQFSIFGLSQSAVSAIGNALRRLLDGYKGLMGGASGVLVAACLLVSEAPFMYEPDTKLHHLPMDFRVIFYE